MEAGFILIDMNAGEHSQNNFYMLDIAPTKVRNNFLKRRIISKKEALNDLKEVLPLLFQSFNEGVKLFNDRISHYPMSCRDRLLETSVFRSCVIERFEENFAEALKIGKYKRVVIRKNNCQILFKKLNNYNLPMNIVTRLTESIYNQVQEPLFNEDFGVTEPIIFFGYRKNRFGEMCAPKLIYIDNNRVQWSIEESEIQKSQPMIIGKRPITPERGALVKPKESVKRKKTS